MAKDLMLDMEANPGVFVFFQELRGRPGVT